jgi:hypothetical protein
METSAVIKKPHLKDRAIQIVKDAEEVLVSLEHLAIRVFIFAMAIYGLIHAAHH